MSNHVIPYFAASSILFSWVLLRGGRTAQRAWQFSDAIYRSLESPFRRVFKQNVRWSLAALVGPSVVRDWFDELEKEPMQSYREANPLLPFKPLRAYGSSRWGMAKRVKVLRDTYRFFELRGGLIKNAALGKGQALLLARIPMGELGNAEVLLQGFDVRFRKEGELLVVLYLPTTGASIAHAAITFEEMPNGTWIGRIGCIQGHKEGHGALNKQVQKALHGLRPKALMVIVAQRMAMALGLRSLQGASAAIQVHRRKHLIHLPWLHNLTFDYDALWTEAAGEPGADGWFELPLPPAHRCHDEIKPNKRSMYARRYKLLEELQHQIEGALVDGSEVCSDQS